jgi:ATP-dependent exoDNAse (exonuclease V) alpha subunit
MRSLHSKPNVLQEYKCYDEYLGDKRLRVAYKKIMDNIAPEVIHLKKGAQVMLTRNLNLAEGLANGSRGVVLECNDAFIEVKFVTGTHLIAVESWEYFDEPNVYTRYQFPLILAYALTIHKSQSCSLDSVVINLGKNIFLPNMGYVSLSRCRNLRGLYLIDYSTESVYADEEAMEYERSENERSENERSESERSEVEIREPERSERNVIIEEYKEE